MHLLIEIWWYWHNANKQTHEITWLSPSNQSSPIPATNHGATLINSLRPSDASKLTIIGSDNGLSPGRRQAIIWTNAGTCILLIGPLGTNFSEILIEIANIFI